jgi:hypothetical protein
MTTMPLTGKEESNKSDDYSWVHLVEEPKKYSRLLHPNPVVFFAHIGHYYLKTIATTKKM